MLFKAGATFIETKAITAVRVCATRDGQPVRLVVTLQGGTSEQVAGEEARALLAWLQEVSTDIVAWMQLQHAKEARDA